MKFKSKKDPKRPPNHIDDPEEYVAVKCSSCNKCWRHVELSHCVYSGG